MAEIKGWDDDLYNYTPSLLEQWVDQKSLDLDHALPVPFFNSLADRVYLIKSSASLHYKRHPVGFWERFPERHWLVKFGAYDYEALLSSEFLETAEYTGNIVNVRLRFGPGEVLLFMTDKEHQGRYDMNSPNMMAMSGVYDIEDKKKHALKIADDFILKAILGQGTVRKYAL